MKIDANELDIKFAVDMVVGFAMFILGAMFDPIASNFHIQHHNGFNIGQVLWCGFWGTYTLWTSFYQKYYGKS